MNNGPKNEIEALRKVAEATRASLRIWERATCEYEAVTSALAEYDAVRHDGQRCSDERNVVPIRGRAMTRAEREEYERPQLVCDPATGLYSIVVADVAVYTDLDPVGRREEIRRPTHAKETEK